ncbi:MAG: nucleotidyltransferase family protein [Geodermatophilaceae bacterium]
METAGRHGAHNLRIFGSVARGEDRADSDIDLLVDLDEGVGLVKLAGLERELSELLGRRVDVVPAEGLKPVVRSKVDRDLVQL